MSGHAHNNGLRSSFVNNISYIEDLTDFQDNGDYSAGRLYTVYRDNGSVAKITVRNVTLFPENHLDPENIVYDITGTINHSPWQVPGERFLNTTQIITPVPTFIQVMDEIEDSVIPHFSNDDKYERFLNIFPIITPVVTFFHLVDKIEDSIIPDPLDDDDR